jgi:hypothetical protein
MVHQLNAEGPYAEFLNSEPEWRNPLLRMPECRIPEPRMTECRKKGTECRNPLGRIGLGAEFSYAELDRIGRIPECRIKLNAKIYNAELD